MRGFKMSAIAALSVLVVMIMLVGYLFMTAEVRIEQVSAQGIPAGNNPEAFEKLVSSVKEQSFQGILFQQPQEWKDASEYVYLTYTIRLRNDCLVPIDMIEAQVVPQSNDLLQIGSSEVRALNPKASGEFQVQVLAPKDTHAVRDLIITYYVWGVSFTLRTTYGV